MTVDEINVAFNYGVVNADVAITVTIGNGQIGGSSMKLNGTPLGIPGEITSCPVGEGLALIGKALIVRTLVDDVSSVTNQTSVTYTLTGGASHPPFTFSHEVANDGDAARYNVTITFVDGTVKT